MVKSCKLESFACGDIKSSSKPVLRLLHMEKGHASPDETPEYDMIVFVLSGGVDVSYGHSPKTRVDSGSIFLMPRHLEAGYTAYCDTDVILCTFSYDIRQCLLSSLHRISSFLPSDYDGSLCVLPFSSTIKQFVESVLITPEDLLGCAHFQATKRDEVLMYMLSGYDNEDLSRFFYHINGGHLVFKAFVLSNYRDVTDVKDFSERANMSISTFTRRFRQTFNTSVSTWLIRKKAEDVLMEIRYTDYTFSEIAFRYGFSSSSYLVTFCKRHFGKSPTELRREYLCGGR